MSVSAIEEIRVGDEVVCRDEYIGHDRVLTKNYFYYVKHIIWRHHPDQVDRCELYVKCDDGIERWVDSRKFY